MNFEKIIQERSNGSCELCKNTEYLAIYDVPASPTLDENSKLHLCTTCIEQIETPELMTSNHWRCLNDSMWSEVPATQVMAWRLLTRLRTEGWPQDLLDMLYLNEETLHWAKASGEGKEFDEPIVKHIDSNGNILQAGDQVVLIKDLDVKGANFTAKRGEAVRNISLAHDNAEHIAGKVNGQHIVILTKFVKKIH